MAEPLQYIRKVDLDILLWSEKYHYYPLVAKCVRLISRTGDGYLQIVFPLLLWQLLPHIGWPYVQAFITAFAVERLLYVILKNTLKRQRPPETIPNFSSVIKASDQFSFPSGHTMAAFMLAGIACLTLGELATPLYLWACLVGASRVALGVHYPSDILAGATLGSVIAIFSVEYLF